MRSRAVIYATVFVDLLGFGIILPALPFYALSFGAGGFAVGMLLAAYSIAQFVAAPLLGRLSDRFGRRPVLLVCLFGSAASLTATGLADSMGTLLAARALAGFFGGSIATAQAWITDRTPAEERTRALGLLGASIGMGFVLGPALGAALSPWGFSAAAFVAGGIAAVNGLVAIFRLEESRAPGAEPGAPRRLRIPLAVPGVPPLLTARFLLMFGFVSMEATFALLGARRYGLTAGQMGLVFTFVGIVMAVAQGALVGRLSTRLGDRGTAMIGAATAALMLAVLPWMPALAIAVGILGLLAAGQGLVTPSLASLLSASAAAEEQGSVLGAGQSVQALARAVGPAIAGFLFDVGPAVPYVLAAGAAAAGGLALLWVPDGRPRGERSAVA